MQDISAPLQAELDKGQTEPIVLVDLIEIYAADAVPGVSGFEASNAIETFAAQEITWNGIAYRREAISRGDIRKSIGETTNSVTLSFSNISRYLATFAQTQQVEGMIVVIRCVSPSVTSDSLVLFIGRAEKPSDIDKQTFSLSVKQDLGNANITVPPNKFEADDPEGRLPSDPLFEGIPFTAISGSLTFPRVEPSTSFLGRLFGRRQTVFVTQQWSSTDGTPYNQPIPEAFGRVQLQLIIFTSADKGSHVGYLAAACRGPIDAIANLKSRTEGLSDPVCSFEIPPDPAVIHLGDPGGTGTNNGNFCQADLARGLLFSGLAYIEGASIPPDPEAAVSQEDQAPVLTAIVRGRKVPVRNSSGVYGSEAWSNNPVDILRFILTDSKWANIDPAFMEDAAFHRTGLLCDFPLIDDSGSEVITIPSVELSVAGSAFTRFLATGLYTPRYFLYNDLGDISIIPELDDGPYIGIDPGDPIPDPHIPTDPTFVAQKPLIKRYTANFPVTEEIRVSDLINKILLPVFKGYLKVNKFGRYEPHSEQPADATRIRSATAVAATSIPILDVTPWITGPELLKGRILLGFGLTSSEVRTPSAALYSTSGNSVSLAASKTGGVTVSASGATLSGGSTSTPATGSITIGGTPATGNTITATIDGIAVVYTLNADDTTSTAAAMLVYYINGTQRLNKYIRASWVVGSPDLVSLTCLHGALTVPALLLAHDGPVADPSSAPTVAAAASGALAAGTYLVAYSNVNSRGSTSLTPIASVVLTANQQINVSSLPTLPAGITSRDFYISEKPNSINLRYVATRTDAADFSINAMPAVEAAMPPSYNTTAEELLRIAKSFATNSQDVYPAWRASLVVVLDEVFLPTVLNGHKYKITTAGTLGATEPTWPTGAGATVASGTAVFTEFGSTVLAQAGLTRSNVIKDSFKFPLGSQQPTINQIKGSYRSAKDDFALQPFTVNDRDHQTYVKKTHPLQVDLSAVDNFNQVKRLGNFLLSKYREGDWFVSLGTGPSGLVLEEGDVICSSDDAGGLINVVTRIEEIAIKANHDVVIGVSRRYSTRMFSDDVGAHRIPVPSTLRFTAIKDTLFELIDCFPTRDEHSLIPGLVIAASHDLDLEGDWRGWTLHADYGDGYVQIAEGDVPATMGTATTTLQTITDPSVFDRTSSVTFTLKYEHATPPFSTVPEADLLANINRNLFVVGSEYVQAATVVYNGNRSYTISTLLRGRLGTDGEFLTHTSSERVVFLNGAPKFVPINISRLNETFDYKVATTNQDVADATARPFMWIGGNMREPSPVQVTGARDDNNNLFVAWLRRDRRGFFLPDLVGTPLSEAEEIYHFSVLDGADVVRGPIRIQEPQLQDLFYERIISVDKTAIETDVIRVGIQDINTSRALIRCTTSLGPPLAGLTHGNGVGFMDNAVGDDGLTSWSFWLEAFSTSSLGRALRVYSNGVLEQSTDISSIYVDDTPIELKMEIVNNQVEAAATIGGRIETLIYRGTVNGADLSGRDLRPLDINGATEVRVLPQRAGFLYSADQQTADGLTPGGPVTVRIAQESSIVGVGPSITVTV